MSTHIDIDLEMQFLGAAMRSLHSVRTAIDLSPEDFSDPVHSEIWRAIRDLARDNKTASPVALMAEVGENIAKLGGKDYIGAIYISGDRLGPASVRAADRIRQLSLWRKIASLEEVRRQLTEKGEPTPEEVASRLISYLQASLSDTASGLRTKKDVAESAIEVALQPDQATPTLIYELDLLTHGGLRATRFYGIGGLYGRGKTILAGTISENINSQKIPHLFFSLETPPEDIEVRNIARAMNINASAIFDSEAPNHKFFRANTTAYLDQMIDSTIFAHSPGATIDDVERAIIQCIHKYDIKGFIIDYWQLIQGKERGQSEDEHLRRSADRLAAICRREKLWGVIMAQIDENGNLANCPLGLKRACSLYLSLRRDPNGAEAQFVTEKSNYTRLANIGTSEEGSGIVFDMAGPHFRSSDI